MMVGIVVVSHSEKIAEGAVELASQMAPDVEILAAGGTDDGRIGTSLEKVTSALEQALHNAAGDGVVVLTDLGSAVMTAETGVEFSDSPDAILLADAPLVEGLVAAAVAAQGGEDAPAVLRAAESVRFGTSAEDAVGGPGLSGSGVSGRDEEVLHREPDASGAFELINPMGIHARPAAKIAGGLAGMDVEATVNGVDGTSMMELMTLAAGKGSTLEVKAWGRDSEKAVRYIQGLVERGFGEI